MWKYIKKYLFLAVVAGLFMGGEVLMDLLQPGIMRRIVDEGVLGAGSGGGPDLPLIWRLGLMMVGLVLFGGLCGSLNNTFVQISSQNIGNGIRKDCFGRLMAFSFPQMDRFGTGSLVTRVTNDVVQVQAFCALFVRGLLRNLLIAFGSMYFMFRLNPRFGLIVLGVFPILAGVVAFCMWKANPLFSRLQAQLDTINGIMQEDVSGIRIIKACVREVYEKMRFGKANDALIRTQLKTLVIFSFLSPVAHSLMYLAVAAILLAGSFEVAQGAGTPGSVMAAITYSTQMLHSVLMLVMHFQVISRGLASWKRIREILGSVPELADGDFDGATAARGEIEFRDVSFAYPGSSQDVLSHIDLKIRGGETVGIMGATGCGKTALASLIPRFYDAGAGTVLVDGVDVREYRQEALREKISIAMQKTELFGTTIGENIAWGQPGAGEDALRSAAAIAQAEPFILSKEKGYDTIVAERGMSLSGGQKQRISLARAVLKPAEIFIFDDATSALDLKTEADFYKALNQSRPDSTKIIIAQRIASVRGADRILVLEQGRAVACGSHEELMASCQVYQDIYHSQLGEEAQGA